MIVLVDESIQIAGNGCYLIAAVYVPEARKANVRRAIRRAALGRFHWKHERPDIKRAMLQVVAAEAAHLSVYVCQPAPRRRHEKIRGELFGAMLRDLGRTEATELLVESRQSHNDQRDLAVIAQAQRVGLVSVDLNYSHGDPLREPLLWMADALAGAAMAQARGDAVQYLNVLPTDRLTVTRTP